VVEAKRCLKYGFDAEALLPRRAARGGAVVHYDTAFPLRYGLDRYELDPATELLARARRLVAVCLSLPPEQLVRQFHARRRHRRARQGPMERLLRRCLRPPWRSLRGWFANPPALETADLYRDRNWIVCCEVAWGAFIRRKLAARPAARLLRIEPCATRGRGPSFCLRAPTTRNGA
jgi:hypothetical protein